MQMFTIRREQGRLREIAPLVRHFVEQHGVGAAWRPGLALIYADLGLEPEARAEFERLAANDFAAIPRDALWQTSLCYLAEVCDYLQDRERAGVLYELLRPYSELAVVVANATVCLGATSRFLGQLATVTGRWDEAEAHFQHALDLNTRMEAVPWLTHTRFQYSRLLLRRGRQEDMDRADALLDEAIAISRNARQLRGLLSVPCDVHGYCRFVGGNDNDCVPGRT
jgi:tetratricopeptide (TPR) repeat protein